MDLKEIKQIIDLMSKNSLAEFTLEKDGFKIHLKKEGSAIIHSVAAAAHPAIQPPVPHVAPVSLVPAILPASAPAPTESASNTKDIVSPMVGTFYRAPSPDSGNYVEVGQQVTEDTVVCIIEAMKVMNEIKAEIRGTITEVLVENGKSIEFGKPLFKVKV
ncbi:MAG: acetyl-CoA carboxylase biotin carboxyl carrier protein [Verrucomicrobiae bacterium]|nr:acetyl-CoA carboxylase biotin carboxyl carrier protein [Verrucomicrobiae bacterium]